MVEKFTGANFKRKSQTFFSLNRLFFRVALSFFFEPKCGSSRLSSTTTQHKYTMPSKKARAKAKKVAAARAPPSVPVKALAGPGQDDLARSKKADLRAARRLMRNYTRGTDTLSTRDDQRFDSGTGYICAMISALTQDAHAH